MANQISASLAELSSGLPPNYAYIDKPGGLDPKLTELGAGLIM